MVQAPPTRLRLSSTSTSLPARARYVAQAKPLWPAPTTTISQRRAANSRTGAGNPISPRTAAVGEITAVVSTVEHQVGKQTITAQINAIRVGNAILDVESVENMAGRKSERSAKDG